MSIQYKGSVLVYSIYWPSRHKGVHICCTGVNDSQILVPFALWAKFPSYRPFLHKCTQWLPKDFEHYKVKGTPHTCVISVPASQISLWFALQRAVLEMHGCQKSEMHRMTSHWPGKPNGESCRVCTKHLPQKPKFWSVSPYNRFRDTRLSKIGNIRNAPHDPRMTLNT